MGLSAGIVGLPNVGKSTLFNALTNLQVEAANYHFATIEPNVGLIKVPDERLYKIASLINPEKTTPTFCRIVDIAGLVKGASKGEGLGNKFLANIREVDAIINVVRCFNDKNVLHYYNSLDPIRDIEIIDLELIMADYELMEKKIIKISSKAKSGDKDAIFEEQIALNIIQKLKSNKKINLSDYDEKSQVVIKSYNLLSAKPFIYVCNIDDASISNPMSNEYYEKFYNHIISQNKNSVVIPLSVSLEYEISKLSDNDKISFMSEFNMKEQALNVLINNTYAMLNIKTFFTFGKDEVRAWSFINGMTAPECAGIIHSDIQKGFIRAEIMTYDDLIQFKFENAVKDAGKLRSEGKSYLMKDGDVVYFKFNV